MGDVFDEREDLRSARSIMIKLLEKYNATAKSPTTDPNNPLEPDDIRRRVHIVNRWPGDEIVMQLVKDAARIMAEFDINPKHVR